MSGLCLKMACKGAFLTIASIECLVYTKDGLLAGSAKGRAVNFLLVKSIGATCDVCV